MKSGLRLFLLFSILILCACAPNPNRVQTLDTHRYSSDGSHLVEADPDTVSFEDHVRGHLTMPEEEQEVVREMALENLKEYESFEGEVSNRHDSIYRLWYHDPATRWSGQHQGVGLGNSLTALKEAIETDPSFVEAWTALGELCNQVGDWESALAHFDKARVAADVRREFDRPVDDEVQLELYRGRAWALRDLARWDEGLVAVREGLDFRSGDQELVLIYGLLLAGAGRYEEAVSLAVRMPAIEFPHYNMFFYGLKKKPSTYANKWIRSQALVSLGDYEGARRILGEMEFYPYTGLLLYSDRFWRDVGLAAELAGDNEAGLYYSIGHITREYWGFYPLTAESLGELVLDVPDKYNPVFMSFGNRFYAGGSYLTYIAVQMNRMAMAQMPARKQDAAGRALQALQIAERRNIRPDVCRAMRGRVYYYNDDFTAARGELLAARNAFKAKGLVDPGTSLLLGLLEMQNNRYQSAAKYLDEVVVEEPQLAAAWRSLGVVYDQLGLPDQALASMDRAIEIEPRSVPGRYNRGLFHMQHGQQGEALKDLRIAAYLDPENREIQRMLELAGSGGSAADPTVAISEEADPDPEEILALLESDIEKFFAEPESLGIDMAELQTAITDLESRYVASPEKETRKILALAYIDARRLQEAQDLLAPGWGVDLDPDEEIMLLFVDHRLNEQDRARELATAMVNGEATSYNPYTMAMTAMALKNDPRGPSSIVNNNFLAFMPYAEARNTYTTAFLAGFYMRVGHANWRGSTTYDKDVFLPMPAGSDPFFRALGSSDDGGGSANAGVPTAFSGSGNK